MARRVSLVMFLCACLAVASCGNDGDSPEPAGTTGTTGSTDPRSQIPDIPEIPSRSERGRGSRSGNGGAARGNDGSRGSETSPGEPDGSTRRRSKAKSGTGKPGSGADRGASGDPQFSGARGAQYERARQICANVTLEGIAVNLRTASRDPEFVAKAYSRSYRAEYRRAAYEGCLEGFRHQVELRR